MPRVIELAGLPGAGKTAVCRMLVDSLGKRGRSIVGTHHVWLRRSRLTRLLLPVTLRRFHPLLSILAGDQHTGEPLRGTDLLRWILHLLGAPTSRLSQAELALRLAFYSLNALVAEYYLFRIEARLRRKTGLLDEGFVQRGTGLWTCAPMHLRERVWGLYLSCLPKGITCIVFDCDPEQALSNSRAREQGLPWLLRVVRGDDPDADWLDRLYRGIAALFNGAELAARAECVHLPPTDQLKARVEQLSSALERYGNGGESIVFARS